MFCGLSLAGTRSIYLWKDYENRQTYDNNASEEKLTGFHQFAFEVLSALMTVAAC